jgi:phosphoglycolate phosphatase-like HAD superfamily hydrolase
MCRFIERRAGLTAHDILMVGDSNVDRAFASRAGCDFLPFSIVARHDDPLAPANIVGTLLAQRD